ncbi:hypothetical protein PMI14_01331, partial [Acidovorax sp. CF316]
AAAAAAAASAINAPGTQATSTTSMALSTGTKAFTLAQTGKLFPVGGRAYAASQAAPTLRRMVGTVTANDPGTGAFTMSVLGAGDVTGSGTYTDWVISIAGEGTALPATAVPDAGKVLGVTSGGVYGLLAARGAGAATTAPFGTINAATAAVHTVTPTSYGQWVKLPDATLYDPGLGLLTVRNAGAYDLAVRDNAGTVQGFVRGGESTVASLVDDTTAAGVWALVGAEMLGTVVSAEVAHGLGGVGQLSVREVIALDADRELIIFTNNVATQAIVWDGAAGVFGALATVRTHDGNLRVRAIKSAANQALVVSGNSTTALEGVVLSISGTTITVGTAAGVTLLAASIAGQSLSPWGDLIPVAGQGFVFTYSRSSSVQAVRALTITGTTVAWGAESVLTGTAAAYSNQPLFDMGSSRVAVFSSNGSTSVHCQVFTVTGTSLAAGTNVTLSNAGLDEAFIAVKLPTGRIAVVGTTSGQFTAAIFTITGTVPTVSSAALPALAGYVNAWKVIGNSVLFAANLAGTATFYVNAVTDVSGTATIGTALQRLISSTAKNNTVRLGADTTSMSVLWGDDTVGRVLWRVGMSGNNPVLLNASYAASGSPTGATTAANGSYPALNTSGNLPLLVGRHEATGANLEQPGTGSGIFNGGSANTQASPVAYRSRRGVQLELVPRASIGINSTTLYPREDASALWGVGVSLSSGTTYHLTKLKVA